MLMRFRPIVQTNDNQCPRSPICRMSGFYRCVWAVFAGALVIVGSGACRGKADCDSESVSGYIVIAERLEQAGRSAAAVQTLDRGLAVHPGSGDLYSRKAALLMRAGRKAESLEAIRRAVEICPNSPVYLRAESTLLAHAGDRAGALRAIRRAREEAPNDPMLLINEAELLFLAGDAARGHFGRGSTLWFAGEKQRACDELRAAAAAGHKPEDENQAKYFEGCGIRVDRNRQSPLATKAAVL